MLAAARACRRRTHAPSVRRYIDRSMCTSDPRDVRISRVAVVLGSIAACTGIEHLSSTSQKSVVILPGATYDFGMTTEYSTKTTSPSPYFTIRAQSSADDDYVETIKLGPTCGSDFALVMPNALPFEVYCMGGVSY